MLFGIIAVLSCIGACAVCAAAGAFSGLACLWILPLSVLGFFLALTVLAFVFLMLLCAGIDPNTPQEKDSRFYRAVITLAAGAVMQILQIRLHTRGMEKMPEQGRFLLVCNHIHDLDPVVLLHCFPKSGLSFISKKENSSMFLVGKLMHKIRCQPIDRENDREALKTIIRCINMIKKDEASIAVFPEGYTHKNRLLYPFRPGAFKIALKTNAPIVVCTVMNTDQAFANAVKLKRTDVELHLLEVIQPEQYRDMTTVELSELVHDKMACDLGQEYLADT